MLSRTKIEELKNKKNLIKALSENSITNLAEKLKVKPQLIHYYINKYNIDRDWDYERVKHRKPVEQKIFKLPQLQDREWLLEQLKKYSISEISLLNNISRMSIYKYKNIYGFVEGKDYPARNKKTKAIKHNS